MILNKWCSSLFKGRTFNMFSNNLCIGRFLFFDFDHFVIKVYSTYKDLSLLKFGGGGFIFSPCWNHRIVLQRTMIIFM
jgi:hypothetical protein